MQSLLAPLERMPELGDIGKQLKTAGGSGYLSGCTDSSQLHIWYGLSHDITFKMIVTYSDTRAREIFEEYRFYDRNVMLYPAKDLIFFQADIHGNRLTAERIKALRRIASGRPITLITTFAALMSPQVMWEDGDILDIHKRDSLDLGALQTRLVDMGYDRVYQVEAPGQFALRGGILDIFDLTEDNPFRVELWGDEVDSIRSFDVLSQRSVEELQGVSIYPATEFVMNDDRLARGLSRIRNEAGKQETEFRSHQQSAEAHRVSELVGELEAQLELSRASANLDSFIHYFYEKTVSLPQMLFEKAAAKGKLPLFILDETDRIRGQGDAVELEFRESMIQRVQKGYILPGQAQVLYEPETVLYHLKKGALLGTSALPPRMDWIEAGVYAEMRVQSIAPYHNSFELMVRDLKKYTGKKYGVLLLSASRTRGKRLAEDLRDAGLGAAYTEDPYRPVLEGEVLVCYGSVKRGFEYPELSFAVISETDLFGGEKKRSKKKKKQKQGQAIQDFHQLQVGDYVVHENHGLGIYRGIEKVERDNVVKDYLKIEYRDGGNLYILATGLDVIQKYASADSKKPRLNKLGTKEWERTKTKVKGAVGEIARDLVELYAARQEAVGHAFGKDTVWQREFEEMFPYEETEDQLAAIADTKKDMESSGVMDRLVCGDVGYGKTEIAIRAAFKAIQEGKQVVYLVPTTILAQQHYNTFVKRMKDFPVRVELLSRFRTPGQIKAAISELKKGFVDIIIGTHRVLSADVVFKDLGLLIIDEEQRFGVGHKEKIKKLKENVDVLTLSATPIPRTLHMSLVGIRDMSLLEEAPGERLPIQTFVCEYNEEMVREAIVRELSRGGQVYYVYNRVNDIERVAAGIAALIPEARVEYAHGQMKEHELERIMMDFVEGEIQVLVSTTIIETGLDISNVNTIVIHDSDQMGLSQLYQLRGRVGRSNKTAYAFLMYRKDKMLKEVAEKRLAAIREFTDLGSGFRIAMRDLEIRGAGNLLGVKQHGHMEAVGYDMYCRMLGEAVKKQKGLETVEDFTTQIDLDVDAFIPGFYIVNEVQKLDIYKRIAGIENEKEKEDMRDELLDRFGSIPGEVENLLRIALIRVAAHRLYLTEIKGGRERISFLFKPDAPLDPTGIPELIRRYKEQVSFTAPGIPTLTFRYKKSGVAQKDAALLLEATERLLEDMKNLLKSEKSC